MYQTEHNELFESIRKGEAKNDGEWMAHSTMLAILEEWQHTIVKSNLGRCHKFQRRPAPDDLGWDDKFDPGGVPMPENKIGLINTETLTVTSVKPNAEDHIHFISNFICQLRSDRLCQRSATIARKAIVECTARVIKNLITKLKREQQLSRMK